MRVTLNFIVLHLIFAACNALNCRSDGGPKEGELKKIYRNCLKRQENKNSSDTRGYSSDDDWKDSRNHNSFWDNDTNRDDRMSERSRGGDRERFGDSDGYGRNDRNTNKRDRNNDQYDMMSGRGNRMNGRDDDGMDGRSDNMDNRGGRMGDRDNRMSRDRTEGSNDRMGNRNDMFGRNDHVSARDDFLSNDGFGEDMPRYNGYQSTQSPRRFKREKRVEMNSGQRSQYNPNMRKSPMYENKYSGDKNFSGNSTLYDSDKACALHCFMENLQMTGDDGLPDRYLVTHAITKEVKNEDLRDFLQESIEECFQILDNENTEDKCEFSKNLLMCLSEKGKANCDDWKDDIQF